MARPDAPPTRSALCAAGLWIFCCALAAASAQGLPAKPEPLASQLPTLHEEAMSISHRPASLPADSAPTDLAVDETGPVASEAGLASWYGARFHRRRTASGELFDMRALTAAHPRLPFGSRVCVRSQTSRRTVVVRINDRGPHVRRPGVAPSRRQPADGTRQRARVIDLSHAAAEALGMTGDGLKPVELFALEDDAQDC